jgi:non-specific serine/threonine protein kinase
MRRRRRIKRLLRTITVSAMLIVAASALILRARSLDHRRGAAVRAVTATKPAQLETTLPPGPPDRLAVTATPMLLPSPLSRAATVVDGGDVVVLGGLAGASPGASVSSVQRLDVEAGTVTSAGRLPAAAHDAAATIQGDNILVFGGGEAVTVDTVQRLPLSATTASTTTTSAARRKKSTATTQATAAAGGRIIGHLPRPRSDLVAVTVGGRSYLLGGFDGRAYATEVLETEDGVTFMTVARLPVPVRYPAVAVADGSIYLFGGQSAKGAVTAVQRVDVAAGGARVVGQLPSAVTEATAFVLRGGVYLAGGRSSAGRVLNTISRVDLDTGRLTPVGTLPVPMANTSAATVGDTVYLVGGEGVRRLVSVLAVRPD